MASSYRASLHCAPACLLAVTLARLVAGSVPIGPTGQRQLSRLSRKATRRLQRLLGRPTFGFLGDWRSNVTFLQEVNAKLVSGSVAVIDNFLMEDVAEAALQDTLRGVSSGWLRPVGTPWAASGVDDSRYHGATSAADRCRFLHAEEPRIGFKFRYHVLDPRGHQVQLRARDFPGHMRVYAGLQSPAWMEVLLMLLTGSEDVPLGAEFEIPYYREYRPGDYALLHNDVDGGSSYRALCVNYWLADRGWDMSRGGGFLWCGHPSPGIDARGKGLYRFLDAVRVPPSFNSASLFAPGSDTWHAVDLVKDAGSYPQKQGRLSFTSWLHVPREGTPRSASSAEL